MVRGISAEDLNRFFINTKDGSLYFMISYTLSTRVFSWGSQSETCDIFTLQDIVSGDKKDFSIEDLYTGKIVRVIREDTFEHISKKVEPLHFVFSEKENTPC